MPLLRNHRRGETVPRERHLSGISVGAEDEAVGGGNAANGFKMKSSGRVFSRDSIAEGLRTSTVERFQSEKSPEGVGWTPSIRARESGGKTLTDTTTLKTSIHSQADESGLAVGTNDIRAATLQFGDGRTIRAKNAKCLTFKVGGQWRRAASVRISIPPRPFLGISDEDELDIRESLEDIFKE